MQLREKPGCFPNVAPGWEFSPIAGFKQTSLLTPCHLSNLAGCYWSQLQGLCSSCNHLCQSASVPRPSVPSVSIPSASGGGGTPQSSSQLLTLRFNPPRWLTETCSTSAEMTGKHEPRECRTCGCSFRQVDQLSLFPHTELKFIVGWTLGSRVLPNGRAWIPVWFLWFTAHH